ncbi:hypothetical protein B0H10DRAFT_2210902 [Mycena sp. CBHHK59/15]|nr:hypothetical protein B0H10DRAFT_2210902 [Mycena sp. CBHHK59/15]
MAFSSQFTIPSRNREATNVTKRGFNDPNDLLLGFPADMLPSVGEDDDYLDPKRNASWFRHDLALPYCYEHVEYYKCEGEWLSFPVVQTVYRCDRALHKSEIVDCLRHGTIPARYPPRISGGVVNDPMNEENFKRMVSRFYISETYIFDKLYTELRERRSKCVVQAQSHTFEEHFWRNVATACSWVYLGSAFAGQILWEVHRRSGKFWYLNALKRSEALSYRIREGRNIILRALSNESFSDP